MTGDLWPPKVRHMKALVTGATGFIGGHLVGRLITRGDEVHVVTRVGSDLSRLPERVMVHQADWNAEGLCDLLRGTMPDVVFHLASRFQDRHESGDIDGLIDANVAFGTKLADAMVRAGCLRLINTGTSWQHFGNADYAPVCLYAATKQAFEALLRYFSDANGLRVVTLKLFDTYGPDDRRGKLLSSFARLAAEGTRFDMSPGEQLIDLVHVDDVVAAYLVAADRLRGDEVNGMESYAVSSGQPLSLRELAALFGRVCGTELPIVWGARPYRPREVMLPWSNGMPIPGWSPRIPLAEGLTRLLA